MRRSKRWMAGLAVLFVALAGGAVGRAIFVELETENVPIERVVANLEKMLQEEPANINWRLNLARLHAMAYASKAEMARVITSEVVKGAKGQPFFGHDVPYRQFEVVAPKDAPAAAVAAKHLRAAIAAYRDVLKRAPDNSIAELGLGWCLALAGEKPEAITVLRRVAEREWVREQRNLFVRDGQPAIVEEAARYLIPLLDASKDAAEIASLRERALKLARQGRYITPIAIPLRAGVGAVDITDESASVLFDADGSGIPRRWTWITSDAAWLVFDRKGTRQMTSALQWFGSVTFWLFWDNGYDALRTLDDNGDRDIRGAELNGLALWHDRNGDGVSDMGEVRPVADHDIVALSTWNEHDALHPDEIAWSRDGVTFASGEVRPTFDIILRTGNK